MLSQFDHNIDQSLYLWVENELTNGLQAVYPTGSLVFSYSTSQNVPNGLNAFYSPYRSLVGNGLNSPTGFYINGQWTGQSLSSPYRIIDWKQGRILLDTSYGTGAAVSGDFATKRVNCYITDENDQQIIAHQDWVTNGQTYLQAATGVGKNRHTIPAVFVTANNSENLPFALGGEDNTIHRHRLVVIADSNYVLKGVLSYFRDKKSTCIKILDYEEYPFNTKAIKDSEVIVNLPYSYTGLVGTGTTVGQAYLEDVMCTTLKDSRSSDLKLDPNIKIGFIDIELSTIRAPRA